METQIKREMVDRQINNLLSKLLLDQVFYYLQLNTFLTYSEMLLIGNGTVSWKLSALALESFKIKHHFFQVLGHL